MAAVWEGREGREGRRGVTTVGVNMARRLVPR